jgi:hypothetical protein
MRQFERGIKGGEYNPKSLGPSPRGLNPFEKETKENSIKKRSGKRIRVI